ncbi:hypothetical protein [Glycomyces tritici]|uniref:Uncharacterized protein n=1 Tax=Glycomyces tritici TaxID=2665176 RepID=A0ABT7YWU9_9ACTN|nr:hypothetical protein [Glycomyces tritici]MDN3243112.1 hypothetical protein [Glycomyces tritici]
MTQKTTPLRRTTAALARTAAACSLAGLAVAAFAVPAQAAGDVPNPFLPPYASVRITGGDVDNRDFSVRITGRDQSVRITGEDLRKIDPDNREFSVRITGPTTPDNRDFSVRITGFDLDNRDMSVDPDNNIQGERPSAFTPPYRQLPTEAADNRDM